MDIIENLVENQNEKMSEVVGTAPVKRGKRRKNRCYTVRDMELLYQLADAGLLDKLHGITCTGKGKIYFFDRIPDVREIIEKFKSKDEV